MKIHSKFQSSNHTNQWDPNCESTGSLIDTNGTENKTKSPEKQFLAWFLLSCFSKKNDVWKLYTLAINSPHPHHSHSPHCSLSGSSSWKRYTLAINSPHPHHSHSPHCSLSGSSSWKLYTLAINSPHPNHSPHCSLSGSSSSSSLLCRR